MVRSYLIPLLMLAFWTQCAKAQPCEADFGFSVNEFTVSFYDSSDNAASWDWDFGDGNTSTDPNPVHTYSSEGSYNVCLEMADSGSCIDTICMIVHICDKLCVWPGDANSDGIANHFDMLPIGLKYGMSGPSRMDTGIAWEQHTADTLWSDSLADGTNTVHVDCDGNGLINADDTLAIAQNYGLTHTKTTITEYGGASDPPFYIEFTQDSVMAGDTAMAELKLGTASEPATDIYGLAYTLNYDVDPVDSNNNAAPDYQTSWLGTLNNDMIALSRDFYSAGRVESGVTRIDQNNVSNAGLIARLFFVTKDNVSGKKGAASLHAWLSGVKIISSSEVEQPAFLMNDSIVVYEKGANIPPQKAAEAVKVYPNPAKQTMHITYGKLHVHSLTVRDLTGKILARQTHLPRHRTSLDVEDYAGGIYFITLTTADQVITRKVQVVK